MANHEKAKREAIKKKHKRIRTKVSGTAKVPRLSVYRSNKSLFVQLIDDKKSNTLTSVSNKEVKTGKKKIETAKELGKLIAKKAQEKGIESIVFDRGGYKYHGRVKAVADGAREAGLKF